MGPLTKVREQDIPYIELLIESVVDFKFKYIGIPNYYLTNYSNRFMSISFKNNEEMWVDVDLDNNRLIVNCIKHLETKSTHFIKFTKLSEKTERILRKDKYPLSLKQEMILILELERFFDFSKAIKSSGEDGDNIIFEHSNGITIINKFGNNTNTNYVYTRNMWMNERITINFYNEETEEVDSYYLDEKEVNILKNKYKNKIHKIMEEV